MKKKLFILCSLILLILMNGCEKQLQLDPLDTLTDEAYWKTPNDFKLYSNSFYDYLPAWEDQYLLSEDIWTDLIASLNIDNVSNSTYSIPEIDPVWTRGYSQLRAENYLIEKANNYSKPEDIKEHVAVAKFFRAYTYWVLFKRFGGVPIINKVLDVNSPELLSTRASREVTFNQILSDLETAIPDLRVESDIPSIEKGRISKGAAQALAAKVSLYEGTWNKFRGNTARANDLLGKAISYAESVMADPSYELFYSAALGTQSYRYMFILENQKSNPAGVGKKDNKEYILTSRYDVLWKIAQVQLTHLQETTQASPTRKMADMYLCSDGLPITVSPLFKGKAGPSTEFQNRDPRMSQNMRVPGKKYWASNLEGRVNWTGDAADSITALRYLSNFGNTRTGYNNLKWCTERNSSEGTGEAYDIPVIRLAEILLTYAEAKFELNGSISDVDLNKTINRLRDRVGMVHLTNALVKSNGLDMRTEIRRERNVELYHENKRYDDLIRWKTAEVELPQPLTGVLVTGTWRLSTYTFLDGLSYNPPSSWEGKLDANGYYLYESADHRVFNQRYYQFPIPTRERILNPNLEQNSGWE